MLAGSETNPGGQHRSHCTTVIMELLSVFNKKEKLYAEHSSTNSAAYMISA
jgi:hypothetical protein